MSRSPAAPDWDNWYARWEAMQSSYMPAREERFTVIVGTVAAICGASPRVVDLGCGPGSLARRVLDGIPEAQVTAIDTDPVLLAIGRQVHGDQGGRLRFVDADLRGPWEDGLQLPLDAAVSTTALHWLPVGALGSLYDRLGRVLRAGGAFVDGDNIDPPGDEPRIAAAARAIRDRERRSAPPLPDAEDWEAWWSAVEREPGLAAEVAERARRRHHHPEHAHDADLTVHVAALRAAGFAEVDTLWQRLSDRVLVAVR